MAVEKYHGKVQSIRDFGISIKLISSDSGNTFIVPQNKSLDLRTEQEISAIVIDNGETKLIYAILTSGENGRPIAYDLNKIYGRHAKISYDSLDIGEADRILREYVGIRNNEETTDSQ